MVAMRNLMAAAVHSSVWAYACVKFYQQAQGILVYVPCNDEPCVYYNFLTVSCLWLTPLCSGATGTVGRQGLVSKREGV